MVTRSKTKKLHQHGCYQTSRKGRESRSSVFVFCQPVNPHKRVGSCQLTSVHRRSLWWEGTTYPPPINLLAGWALTHMYCAFWLMDCALTVVVVQGVELGMFLNAGVGRHSKEWTESFQGYSGGRVQHPCVERPDCPCTLSVSTYLSVTI